MKLKNNLIDTELQVLNSLLHNKDTLIQKADKSNTTFVVDKDVYKKKMKAIILNLKSLTFKKKII